MDNMKVTWICKLCGAVNTASDGVCAECSAAYTSTPQESTTNQALLNQGVIFNNAVFTQPESDFDEVLDSLDEHYEEEKEPCKPRESLGMRVFTWTSNILMWLAIIICSSVFLFFVWVFIQVFCKIGYGA